MLVQNPFLQTFVFGTLGTSFYFFCEKIYRWILKTIYSNYRCEISINNLDPNYHNVQSYLFETYLFHIPNARANMLVKTMKNKSSDNEKKIDVPVLEMHPNDDMGIYFFKYKKHNITLYRKTYETILTGVSNKPLTRETLTLSTWGQHTDMLLSLFQTAVAEKKKKETNGVTIYLPNNVYDCNWETELLIPARPKETVILDENKATAIIEDCKLFLSNQAWYTKKAIPYRRGYLLYGPPGCGKSSFIQVVASELQLNLCILNLSKTYSDDNFAKCVRNTPSRSILVLEDVDALFIKRSSELQSVLTFSGLLNALDGLLAQQGRILFMTTNCIDKLDAALIRPGRCDEKIEVSYASQMQLKKMFLRFFPGEEDCAQEFAEKVPANSISLAEVQCFFLKYFPEGISACLENLHFFDAFLKRN